MPNMTLAIPAELRNQMAIFPEINWSEVARQAIMEKLRTLARMHELLRNSTVTEAEAITTGRKIRARVARKQQAR